jgi:mannose-1-phosphate guanylyltransferase/phosphomannomutase
MPIHYSESYWKACWTSARKLDSQLKGAILSAGLGRRLDPLTAYHLPKPLFPLGGKVPIAEIWLRRLIRSGITDVSLNVCVLAEAMKRQFGNGAKYGMDLTYVEEEIPTGTLGGACKMVLGPEAKRLPTDPAPRAMRAFSGSTVIVPSGDIVANFGPDLLEEMYDIHRKAGAALTMVLTEIPPSRKKDFGTVVLTRPRKRKGLISLSGRVVEFREKDEHSPTCLSNASIYMIETDLLRALDARRTNAELGLDQPFYDFGKHVFPAMLGNLPYAKLPKDYILWGIRFDGPWFDVGNKRDYLRVNKRVLDGIINVPLTYEPVPWGYLGANVSVDFSAAHIHSPVVIGNDCVIESGAVLGPYAVVGDGWVIEKGAEIRNSVLWERYPYFLEGRHEISARDRRIVDRHEVRRGVRVHESIIAGGCIQADTMESTVDVREDGEMAVLGIDYVPSEPRA